MIIAEPSKSYGKDAYYFSHDSNARNDHKCLKLRRVLGMEGYGIFWVLVEMLRDSAEYKLPLSVVPDIAYETRVSEEKILSVINQFGLFEIEGDSFFSLRLIRSMEVMQLKSSKNRQNALKRWNDATALPPHSERNALKERKGKEKKGNDIKELGDKTQKHFILINSPFANEHKYRLWGVDGVGEFLEMNGSQWPRTDFAEKFLRDKSGQPFNDFGHILNAYNVYIKNQFK